MISVEIIRRETIKPSSPTPNSHGLYKLSLLDKINPRTYLPIILFYPSINDGDHNPVADRTSGLKESLSETLTRYYPLAGRIKDSVCIECDDEGVDFIVAHVDCHLEAFLKRPELEALNLFVHDNPAGSNTVLLGVQVTFFRCGGMAIAASMLHKVGDLSTLSSFINDWASMAVCRHSNEEVSTQFVTSFFPPPPNDSLIYPDEYEVPKVNCVTRRFVFSAAKLDALKELATNYGGGGVVVENPTRVQVVTALIYKSAIKAAAAAAAASNSAGRSSTLLQLVNLRRIVVIPPLQDKSFGNMALHFALSHAPADAADQVEFHGLVSQLKEGIAHFRLIFGKSFTGDGLSSQILEYLKEWDGLFSSMAANNHMMVPPNIYTCSSWCSFPLYKPDFGWGKPIWVSTPICARNSWILMDTRNGDGIEALVTLEEQDMTVFEQDGEFLRFASLNPSALDTN